MTQQENEPMTVNKQFTEMKWPINTEKAIFIREIPLKNNHHNGKDLKIYFFLTLTEALFQLQAYTDIVQLFPKEVIVTRTQNTPSP